MLVYGRQGGGGDGLPRLAPDNPVLFSQHAMFTAIHKHYSLDDWKHFAENHPECLQVR